MPSLLVNLEAMAYYMQRGGSSDLATMFRCECVGKYGEHGLLHAARGEQRPCNHVQVWNCGGKYGEHGLL